MSERQKAAYLTFDIETDWGGRLVPSRETCRGIEHGLPWLIDVLKDLEVKATFFISGEIVQSYKDYFRSIGNLGHELAAHGYCHRLRYDVLPYRQLSEEVYKAKEAVSSIASSEPAGFRTPQFRFQQSLLRVLEEHKFKYDSSVCPSFFSRTGKYEREWGGQVLEHTVSTQHLFNLPAGLLWVLHGGWHRFLREVSKRDEFIFYAHPFDWIDKRPDSKFSLKVNAWYLSIPAREVRSRLYKIIKGLKEYEFAFRTLSEKSS